MDDLIDFLYSPSGIGGLSIGVVLFLFIFVYYICTKLQEQKEETSRNSVNDIHDKLDRTAKPGLPTCNQNEDCHAK